MVVKWNDGILALAKVGAIQGVSSQQLVHLLLGRPKQEEGLLRILLSVLGGLSIGWVLS